MTDDSLARFLFLLIAAALAACRPAVEPADLVLRGGKIVTVDAARPEAQALAVRGDRIAAVGTEAEIAPYVGRETEVLELGGRLAVPGFIEGHGHFLSLGQTRTQLDLTAAADWQEVVAKVAAAVEEAEPGAWITGWGWHQEKWSRPPAPEVGGLPTHAALSAVSPDNPVLLEHASGHATFANARAMALGGVGRATPDPPGGEIVRDAAGEPIGYFRETAQALVARRDPPTEAELERWAELAGEECLAKGVTSFQDAGSPVAAAALLRRVAEAGGLGVRLWLMLRDDNRALAEALPGIKVAGLADHHFTVGGIKHSIDGALGSHGAWLLDPYADRPASTGLNTTPVEVIAASAELALEHGLQLCVHAIGDRANRETLDLYERTFAAHPERSDLRWRVEHAQHLHPDDVPRFARLGVIASVQGVHATSDGPWVPQRLGEERAAERSYLWRSLLDSGAVVANGTDAPVEDVDPVANFYASVTRRLGDGSRFSPEQRMRREEALASMTLTAAYAAFEEGIKGSLTPGKLADVTVLSRDVLTVPEEEILGTTVDYTIVGGEVRYARE